MRLNVYCGNLLDIRRPEVASRSEVARAVQSVLTLPRSRIEHVYDQICVGPAAYGNPVRFYKKQ